MKYCKNCGQNLPDDAGFCTRCGSAADGTAPPPINGGGSNNLFDACGPDGQSRGVAALLAILISTLGVQYFYLGKTRAGIYTILLSLVTCGVWGVITFIQGIVMLTMTNQQFANKYIYSPSTSFPVL